MVKDHDKPRGKTTAYAFFVKTCREEHKKKHPNESVVLAEFSKKCSERWKTMNDQEKYRFQQLASKDKERYQNEMANYKPSASAVDGRGGKKRAKDPNAPKRPLSAFFWFSHEERPKVRANMPEANMGDIAKELGRLWNEYTEDKKARYQALAANDKARYEKELAAYQGGKGAPATKGKGKTAAKAKKESSEEEDEEEEEEEEDSDDE